jgi:hypothetical protein
MKRFYAGFVLLFLVLVAITVSGCTQQTVIPTTPTYTPTAIQTSMPTATPTTGCILTPGPVQMVPSYESVDIQVMKNSISTDPYIITTFAGGKGLGMVVQMETTVTRSNCTAVSGRVNNPLMGSNITLMGTTSTDLVVVNVTMTDGMTYTVVNRLLPFLNPPQ